MYIQPGYLSKKVTGHERLRQQRCEQDLGKLNAGMKNVPELFGSNQSGKGQGNASKKNNIGRIVDAYVTHVSNNAEESLISGSESDDPFVSATKKKRNIQAQELAPSPSQTRAQELGPSPSQTLAQELAPSPSQTPAPELTPSPSQLPPVIQSAVSANVKRKRGPTKLKTIAPDGGSRIEVKFNENCEPIGDGSVKLSSFLGPLVREIVPYTLSDWRKLSEGMAEVLWQSIQMRFNLKEQWHREMVFRKMNEAWRSSKSIFVTKVRNASNEEERLKLQPANVKSLQEWKNFLKEKTSVKFKAKSDIFKDMRKNQMEMLHTMSRKGYARLGAEIKAKDNVSYISRSKVWAMGHRNKKGQPATGKIAKAIQDLENIERNKPESSSTNFIDDALSQTLGPERHGRVRTFGKGVTKTRLGILSQMDGKIAQVHEENFQLKTKVAHMENRMDEFKKFIDQNKATTEGTPAASTVDHSQKISHNTKCKLLDWMGTGDVVAEGRWGSSDPKELVHFIPIGPNAVKVWVDVAKKPEVFLWRTNSEMTYMEEAIGSCVAWPADQVIMDSSLGSTG